MTRQLARAAAIAAVAVLLATGPTAAASKYQRYAQATIENLLLMCVEGDDNGCYFYAGKQAKAGKLKEAHDGYLIGAENAKTRSGFVCMFQLARLYQEGQGIEKDLTQAYRWLTSLMNVKSEKDLLEAATSLRRSIAVGMTAERIALAEALARARTAR